MAGGDGVLLNSESGLDSLLNSAGASSDARREFLPLPSKAWDGALSSVDEDVDDERPSIEAIVAF